MTAPDTRSKHDCGIYMTHIFLRRDTRFGADPTAPNHILAGYSCLPYRGMGRQAPAYPD